MFGFIRLQIFRALACTYRHKSLHPALSYKIVQHHILLPETMANIKALDSFHPSHGV